MERDPNVHIMASGFHGTVYTGVTSNLLQQFTGTGKARSPDLPRTMTASGSSGSRPADR